MRSGFDTENFPGPSDRVAECATTSVSLREENPKSGSTQYRDRQSQIDLAETLDEAEFHWSGRVSFGKNNCNGRIALRKLQPIFGVGELWSQARPTIRSLTRCCTSSLFADGNTVYHVEKTITAQPTTIRVLCIDLPFCQIDSA